MSYLYISHKSSISKINKQKTLEKKEKMWGPSINKTKQTNKKQNKTTITKKHWAKKKTEFQSISSG